MREEIVTKLLALNQDFYEGQAASFAASRAQPQPGFSRILPYLPQSCEALLDVGCGEGRFGRFIQDHQSFERYVGVDFSAELLQIARHQMEESDIKRVDFYQRDMTRPDFLTGLGQFDVIACLAALHHIPGRANRVQLLRVMAGHLGRNGRLILSTWQFLGSQRQQRKIRDWAEVSLSVADVETNDYLLSWQRGGFSYRYACMIDVAETAALAQAAHLQIIHQFRSDGKEGDLSLYTILAREAA